MAVPEFVVADTSSKSYPGGVIAIRAEDWLGAARGTLSTEADARSITGTVVRDSQQVTTSIRTDPLGAHNEADNTLEIDLSLLPIEPNMRYLLFGSFLLEGDWDLTSSDTFYDATQDQFLYACDLSVSFDGGASSFSVVLKSRRREHYMIVSFDLLEALVGDEIMEVRAYAADGTTIELLVDQLMLVPYVAAGTINTWNAMDFAVAGGNDTDFVDDGADGGDDNGKFTWHGITQEQPIASFFNGGGGDYQQDDNEYMVIVNPTDLPLPFRNTLPSPDVEASGVGYSFHGTNWRDAALLCADDFSRTTGPDNWGATSTGGFGWWLLGSVATTWDASTNGSRGILTRNANTGFIAPSLFDIGIGGPTLGPQIVSTDMDFSGVFQCSSSTNSGGTDASFRYFIRLLFSTVNAARSWFVHLDLRTKIWALYLGNNRVYSQAINGTADFKFSSDFDISSWFAFNSDIGFRIEKKRYLLRVRLWDATGAEPSTWDFEGFIPVSSANTGALGTVKNYPYDDLMAYAHRLMILDAVFPSVQMGWTQATAWASQWDDIEVNYDPYGDPDAMTASIEDANAVELTKLVPYGAWQMIHWGTRDFSELDAGDAYLSFASKVWDAAGSAELQRADALMYYFRISRGGIISMNWRSADRRGFADRVLVGTR